MKFLNLSCPQKLHKICKILSYSRFLCNCKYGIIKLNRGSIHRGSIPLSNRKYKGRKKLSTKEKNERKKYRIREYKLS